MSGVKRWFLSVANACISVGNATCALAQITPDSTLPNNSNVIQSGNTFNITGGTQAGGNLFHSFKEFSVPTGSSAIFNNNADIQNIISRVTGGSVSNIDGLIRAQGNANLFLINPDGIIFGQNAQLNIGGSFVTTTANAIQFGERGFFSATNPNTPSLLTVNPSAFFFNSSAAAPIQNNSIAPDGVNASGFNVAGLRVPDGRSILLVSGKISMDGGRLNAFGGRVDLGGVSGAGIVGLNVNGDILSLSFPDSVAKSDVSLSNRARLDVRADNGGSITINARNLNISTESLLLAGIGFGLGSPSSQGGDIKLFATDEIKIGQSSIIGNNVYPNATGNTGNLNITTGSLFVTDGSQLQAITFGKGEAGSVIIDAKESVLMDGIDVFSSVEPTGFGNGGDIRITTGTLSLKNRSQLVSATSGRGDAGSVIINATEQVSLDGKETAAITNVGETGIGKGGDIRITTKKLSVTNNAQLQASTLSKGDAGNVIIEASDFVSFDGKGSSAFSDVDITGIGKGGNIRITTGSLSVTNGAALVAVTYGLGDAGNVQIDAREQVLFDGTSLDGIFRSGAGSDVEQTGSGKGGDIRINTKTLWVTNRAQLVSSSSGKGDAGNIIIQASDRVSFDGGGTAFSRIGQTGSGKGGDIRITTKTLSVTNRAQLQASTLYEGDAGSIIIDAIEKVSFDGEETAAFTDVGSTGIGKGGDIRITTDTLSVNFAQLVANTNGVGNAGNLIINARNAVSLGGVSTSGFSGGFFTSAEREATGIGGAITVDTSYFHVFDGAIVNARNFNSQKGGDVTINAKNLEVTGGGQVFTTTFGSGRAGNITLNVTDKVILSGSDPNYASRLTQFGSDVAINQGAASGLFANTASDSTGQGGNLTINTPRLRVADGASVTVSSPQAQAGNLTVNAKTIRLDQGSLTAETAVTRGEDGANIKLQGLNLLLLRSGSRISARANSTAKGGNITIDATKGFIVAPSREDSDIIASASVGQGGNIKIKAQGIFGIAQGRAILGNRTNDIDASSQFSTPGTVTINTPDVDPSSGLVELPVNLVDTSQQIATGCNPGGRQRKGSFTATGRSGLPPSPTEPLTGDAVVATWVILPEEVGRTGGGDKVSLGKNNTTITNSPTQIVEAQSWQMDDNGDIVLVASAPTATPISSRAQNISCSAL